MSAQTLADWPPGAGELPAPGGWRSSLYREDAPGAVLDSQPWARTWPAFLRAVLSPDDSSVRQYIANAMAERIPSEGGFLVPEYLRSQVLSYMTSAVIRPCAMVLPMSSLRLPVPVLDNPSQANGAQALGGLTFGMVEEGAPIPASTPGFGRAVLEARKVAALLQDTPNELVSDAAGAFGEFLARTIAAGYAWAEDDWFFTGTGVGQPQGLVNAPCQVPVPRSTAGAVMLADIVAMTKALHPAAKQAAMTPDITHVKWLLSASALDQLLELYLLPAGSAPTSGTPVTPSDWMSLGDGDKVGPSLLGIPAVVTDHQPATGTPGDVILADLSQYLIGDRLAMTVERSAQGSGFAKDTSNFRIRSRVDGRYWIQSATTTEAGSGAGQVSPVVVLQ